MLLAYLKLHAVIFLWGFTAILGALIHLAPDAIVFWRTVIATLTLAIVLRLPVLQGLPKLSLSQILTVVGVGTLIGLHWIAFFLGVHYAGVSVCLAGLSTSTLWVALLSPIFEKNRKLSLAEVALGVLIIAGLGLICHADFTHFGGVSIGVFAAFFAALFAIFNGKLVRGISAIQLTYYELMGAGLIATLSLLLRSYFAFPLGDQAVMNFQLAAMLPSIQDLLYLFLLAVVCTVFAYWVFTDLLKVISVFSANISVNMEPIYGMILAAVLLKEHLDLTPSFYFGSLIIMSSVILHPLVTEIAASRNRKAVSKKSSLEKNIIV